MGEPVAVKSQRIGGPNRDVDEAVAGIGAAIVHPHDDGAAIVEIGHPGIAGKRHGRMRRRDAVHVEHFAVGGLPAMEIRAIPGSDAFGLIRLIVGGVIGLPVDGVGLAHLVAAAAFGHRLALPDDELAVFFGEDLAGRAVGQRHAAEHGRADTCAAPQMPPAGSPHQIPAPRFPVKLAPPAGAFATRHDPT